MAKKSAGILLFRRISGTEVFLVHPGGPFWAKKDAGSWSIPKGEFAEEDPLAAAIREMREETGIKVSGNFFELPPCKLKSGKWIYSFATEGDADAEKIISNDFEFEWPPRSGKKVMIPEVDRAAWFTVREAKTKINSGQVAILFALEQHLNQAL